MFDDPYTPTKPRFGYQVVSDVPMPAVHVRQKYPFPFMEVGESFTVPADDPASHRYPYGSCAVVTSACHYGRNHNMKFRSRRNKDNSVTIWRSK